MGQRLSEHPAVDWHTKLVREATATGVYDTLPRRTVDTSTEYGKWEMSQYRLMRQYQTRSVAAVLHVGDRPGVGPAQATCLRCGRPIGKRSTRKRLVRQVWQRDHTRVDYFVCGRC